MAQRSGRVDRILWRANVATGCALSTVAIVLIPVGLFEDNWPDRTTVWAMAIAAGAFAAQLLASAASTRPDDWSAFTSRLGDELAAARTWLWGLCLVLPFVMTAAVSQENLLAATGDLSLVADANGQVSLIVPLVNGGIASCARQGESWSSEWSSPRIDPDWGDPGRSSAFYSELRRSFQLLGQRDGGLVEGRQGPDLTWYGEYDVVVDSRPVTSARGRPAFFQHVAPDSRHWFFALVPDTAGGVRLYWRNVRRSRSALIQADIGLVDSVTAVDVPGEGIKAILRIGDRLLWLTKPPEPVPGAFDDPPWTDAEEVHISSDSALRVVGDPVLIRTTMTDSVDPQRYHVAVPTADGLQLLTTTNFESNSWTAERLPMTARTASVALIDTTIDRRSSLLVAYRTGRKLYATFTTNGAWHPPQPIECVR